MANKFDDYKVYVAGPMRGIPEFNFPMFAAITRRLRGLGWIVFSPAEKDIEHHGKDISKGNETGDLEVASKEHGFSLRRALGDDTAWICANATAICMLPGWKNSKGAVAEHALAVALGLDILEVNRKGQIRLVGGKDYDNLKIEYPGDHFIVDEEDVQAYSMEHSYIDRM